MNNRFDSDDDNGEGDEFTRAFYQALEDFIKEMSNMSDEVMRLSRSDFEGEFFKGFAIGFDENGQPHFKEIGDSIKDKVREPLYEQNVNDDNIEVIVELPGVRKDDLRISASEDEVTIEGKGINRNYRCTVPLKDAVDPDRVEATLVNGVLSIRLKLKDNVNKGYKRINIQ